MSTPLAEWFTTDVDLRHNQLINAAAQNSVTAPVDPVKGQLWFDTSTTPGSLKYWDGTAWTGGRTFYNTVLDDSLVRPQRTKLNFRSTSGINAEVLDEGVQDQSSVQLTPKYGPVRSSLIPGEAAADGVAGTVARSDHSHGSPSDSGSDTVLISWWEYNEALWTQLTASANFIPDLPGQVVGGGWLLTVPGSIYWTGAVIPMSTQGVYRNTVRVSAVNNQMKVSCGWLCYNADKALLGKVACINQVPVDPSTESGVLVNKNYLANPSGEGALTGDPQWHSNGIFGAGAVATITQSTEQFTERTHSVKAVWAAFTGDNTQSNCICSTGVIEPNTKLTFRAKVYVPSGSPRVNLDITFFAQSAWTDLKDQWVPLEIQFTTPNDGIARHFFVGMKTDQSAPGTVAYIDEAIVFEGHLPIPGGRTYFDGYTTSTEDAVFAWDGDADASHSSFYTLEPAWELLSGYITPGDGIEPPVGEVADVEEAVAPLDGTVYFRPYVECAAGTMIIDTHEVSRGTRDMTVMDGLHTGWVTVDETMQAGSVVTQDVAPPDTVPETFMRIGPVIDPPQSDGDVVPKAYVDRIFGAFGVDEDTGAIPPIPPQFLWGGDPGVDPQPADLGFLFENWPLFSMWLDTNVPQVKPTFIVSTWTGTAAILCPVVGGMTQVPNTYGVIITPPVDGLLIGISTGSVYAEYADYMEMRCGIWEGCNEDGVGGTSGGAAGQTVFSGSSADTSFPRLGYTLLSARKGLADTRYRLCTDYLHGGPTAQISRDRTWCLYLPGVELRT